MMQERDETWRRRLEREMDRRRRFEEAYRHAQTELTSALAPRPVVVYSSPDYEEGPHSALNEEEWHDAVDAALERQDIEDQRV